MQPLRVAVLGAGARGTGFGGIIGQFPEWARVVAVAEPREDYRLAFAREHGVPENAAFRDWRDFVARPPVCDAVVIATPDREHAGPAIACMRAGMHLFLEKPMAVTLDDCRAIADTQRASKTITAVCHSLRYHAAFALLRRIVTEGRLGRVMTIDQIERVGWQHQAHSFVRGNWSHEGDSAFMLLAKSCHDIDYLSWLAGRPCRRVASFGELTFFRPEQAPAGSGERCVACSIEPDCEYSAIRRYVATRRDAWPAAVVSIEHDAASHRRAIETGPYGRCVWKCGNDVVDHQVVLLQYEGDITATFTMTAFTADGGREIRVHGTRGEAVFTESSIRVRDFAAGTKETIEVPREAGGHGGGDHRAVRAWLRAMAEGDPSHVLTDVHESLRTHAIVFAAEQSRRERRMVDLADVPGTR